MIQRMIAPLATLIDCWFKQILSKSMSIRGVLERNSRRIVVVSVVCFVVGVILARQLEPGVRVKTVTIAGDTPALQFIPAGPGPHPVALLAHGYTGSKESLFAHGEALAAGGFVCFSVDLPGHGASPRFFTYDETVRTLGEVAQAIGPVNVFMGFSLGGLRGGQAVFEGRMRPKLFIAVGSLPTLGEHAPPLLLLTGRIDEHYPPALLKTRTDAHLVVSPWSNHGLEGYDRVLLNAAVAAACATVGRTPPAAPTRWLWRGVGMALVLSGALGLALGLPRFPPRWAGMRGLLVSIISIFSPAFAQSSWRKVAPHLPPFPLLVAGAVALLVLLVAGRLRIPRWTFLALAAAFWIGCATVGAKLSWFDLSPFWLVLWLFQGLLIGALAAYCGSRRDGDIAMVIIMSSALFELTQTPRMVPAVPRLHAAIKLDTKLLDACVGHYEFAPGNVFPTGLKLTIWRQGDRLAGQWSGLHAFPDVVDIYPESETNFFLTINGRQNGEQLIFIKNDQGEVTAVIDDDEPDLPVLKGEKLKKQ